MEQLLNAFQNATQAGLQNIAAALDQFSKGVAEEIARAKPRAIAASEDDEQLPLDVALFDSAPTVAVPKHAKFVALQEIGHRFLMTAEGVFVEVRRPWAHIIQRLDWTRDSTAKSTGPIPPYGTVEEKVEFAFGRLGSALQELQAFAAEARAALPNEYAAWIIWDAQKQKLQYRPLPATSATPGSITFDRPALAEHESLAIDLHSHGDSAAFFSPTDDADDAGEVKIAGVFGGLGAGSEPDVAFRLCVLGMFIPLKVPAAAIFKQPQEA
ncbi:PRTRC genetic system protein A [Paraburkholderia bannensis]|uniref:PRTRC genetic system protein A n=1 Tax=Paraburkholderia bannensis TaxID=765414 RepID=A0A7W9U3H3_9BURK|nr:MULTISPECIES: PRTRC system protein A [Paraburkholderia]MBB3259969.1 PRTRC genetic system protein A [Paraburkholderia sp. WP4_3_2]MBB6105175.1 PRTRC genetic system protein A [Paraburkholderia bannensis]